MKRGIGNPLLQTADCSEGLKAILELLHIPVKVRSILDTSAVCWANTQAFKKIIAPAQWSK